LAQELLRLAEMALIQFLQVLRLQPVEAAVALQQAVAMVDLVVEVDLWHKRPARACQGKATVAALARQAPPKGQAGAEAQVPLVNPVLPANQVTAATGCSPVFPALRFITQVVAAGAATVLLELVQGDWAAAVMGFSAINSSMPRPALSIAAAAAAAAKPAAPAL
jgi:hypothetical protein